MSKIHVLGLSLVAVLCAAEAFAQQPKTPAPPAAGAKPAPPAVGTKPAPPAATPAPEHTDHGMLLPKDMKWGEGPPSLPKGAKVAVLEGDPSKAGPFTMRLEVPAKYKIAPHWHPAVEHVTVISGEAFMGSGETFDEASAKKLTAGGFAFMPAKYAHFFFTKGKKTVVQVHGVGPWGITYINPADDPRMAAPATPAPAK